MTWAKIHHGTLDKLMMLGLPRGVRLLHIEAVEWSDRNRKNGEIPRAMLVRFTDEPDPIAAATLLVKAGLWVERLDEGWEIVDYLKQQSSAADIEKAVLRNREFQDARRKCRTGDHAKCGPRAHCGKGTRKTDRPANNGERVKVTKEFDPIEDLIRQIDKSRKDTKS